MIPGEKVKNGLGNIGIIIAVHGELIRVKYSEKKIRFEQAKNLTVVDEA